MRSQVDGQDVLVLAAADPAQPYGAAVPWPRRAGARAARVAGAWVVLLDGEAGAVRGARRSLARPSAGAGSRVAAPCARRARAARQVREEQSASRSSASTVCRSSRPRRDEPSRRVRLPRRPAPCGAESLAGPVERTAGPDRVRGRRARACTPSLPAVAGLRPGGLRRCSGVSSRRAPSCRSRSRSTSSGRGPPFMSYARSCDRSSRIARRCCGRVTTRVWRWTSFPVSPAAAIFARAHAGTHASEDDALFRTVLLGLLTSTAESCGGFDWDDEAFEHAYGILESTLFGERRQFGALVPLIGLSVARPVDLAPGLSIRHFAAGELSTHWPESRGLLPPGFGREPDRCCMLELYVDLDAGAEPPDSPAEIADAVSAIRLTTSAALAAGPVPVRDSRRAAVRRTPGAPDRRDAATGGALPPRRLPYSDRGRRPGGSREGRRRPRACRGPRSLGAFALSERAVPGGAAASRASRAPR